MSIHRRHDLVQWLQARLLDRRHSTSCALFAALSIPMLLILWGMQAYALAHPATAGRYQRQLLEPVQWALMALIVWLAIMGLQGWRLRRHAGRLPWLVQSTLVPAVLGFVMLSLGYGLKDTPMGMVLLEEFVLARALFALRPLRPGLLLGVGLVLGAEAASAAGWYPDAPLLAESIFKGNGLSGWWAMWARVVFHTATVPFSIMMFFLFGALKQRRAELTTLGRMDALTGLANRREFMTRLERESHRHARSGRPLSLVLCDIDHFKRVNDTWGHPVGDEVLAQMGRIFMACTRDQVDTAARLGGEEFVLILPDTDLRGAQNVAEKISARLRAHAFRAGGAVFGVTHSVGIAQVVEGHVEWAMRVADANLYLAKHAGRDRIVGSVAFQEPVASQA